VPPPSCLMDHQARSLALSASRRECDLQRRRPAWWLRRPPADELRSLLRAAWPPGLGVARMELERPSPLGAARTKLGVRATAGCCSPAPAVREAWAVRATPAPALRMGQAPAARAPSSPRLEWWLPPPQPARRSRIDPVQYATCTRSSLQNSNIPYFISTRNLGRGVAALTLSLPFYSIIYSIL
jgi:hypothetical protein